MDSTSCQVLKEKIQALDAGDEATVKQIGEGKDIISILSKYAVIAIGMFIAITHPQLKQTEKPRMKIVFRMMNLLDKYRKYQDSPTKNFDI
jgi:hypothetical protein